MKFHNFVLLAAGKGNRLNELTSQTPKPLLPVAGVPAIQRILNQLIKLKGREIVVVTGYRNEEISLFLQNEFGNEIKLVYNERFEDDTNILSVDLGVDALSKPDLGYTIIETDIILETKGWEHFLSFRGDSFSAWATVGCYSEKLTGAAVKVSNAGSVTKIVYAPEYDRDFEGWLKMLGILKVGFKEVEYDRELRKKAINNGIDQYYLNPWLENLDHLPCRTIDLSDYFGGAFNDLVSYKQINQGYEKLLIK
jgi:NDP-sugar pyrophosphorylase family protein